MAESKFWRSIAVALVAGLFYVGHAMHGEPAVDFPELSTQVQAGDVATASRDNTTAFKIITSSGDGRVINLWGASTSNNTVRFIGTFEAKPQGE